MEEIADAGFDVLCVCYTDLSSDDGDFTNGLAGLFYDGPRGEHDAGKLMLWAYGASRILDMAAELPMLDLSRAAVMGHSRLGKTALLAGMLDERFRFVFSNDSGCSGAALSRGNLGQTGALGPYGKTGESIRYITETFPFWFAPCYARFADTNAPEGFDQHHLLAAIAPRYAYVASADMDDWADPDSEFLSCVAASVAWERLGLSGFVHSSRLPKTGEAYQVGHVGYHRRHGKHFLSRHDWAYYMSFIRLHEEDAPAPQPAL